MNRRHSRVLELITAIDWIVVVEAADWIEVGRLECSQPSMATLLATSNRRGNVSWQHETTASRLSSAPFMRRKQALNRGELKSLIPETLFGCRSRPSVRPLLCALAKGSAYPP